MTEVIAEAKILGAALKDLAAIINRAGTLPILSNLLIETVGAGSIRITATDLMKRIERVVPVEVIEGGTFTVEGARFTSVIASYAGQVKLVTDDKVVHVTSGRSRFKFGTLPADQYPPWPVDDAVATFIAGAPFVKALAMTRHAHSTNISQPLLNGVVLAGSDVAATDAQRLSMSGGEFSGAPRTIVPTGAVDLILKLASDEFTVTLSEKFIRCDFGDTVMQAKLIDGTYPDYARIIPNGDMPVRAIINADDLRAALGRFSLMADDKDRKVRLAFEAGKLTLSLDANVDAAAEDMPCQLTGDPLVVGFRSQYLRDALVALDADDVTMDMIDARGPMRMTAEQRPGAVLVVMPITVG